MKNIENGFRYETIKAALADQPGVILVGEITREPVFDGRKGQTFTETKFVVAPADESLDTKDLREFGTSLLPDIEPIFRQDTSPQVDNDGEVTVNGRLRSFDRIGENEFRTITVEIHPRVETALWTLEGEK